MTKYSEQLEHEAEATRWQVSQTLDELRNRITPGQLVDQVVDYAREGGAGQFVRNLGRQVKENPLPLTLIGAGIAWLMMGNGRANGTGHAGGRMRDAAHRLAERTSEAAGVLGETTDHTKVRAEAALHRAADSVEHAAGSAQHATSSTWHRTAGTATSAYRRVAHRSGELAGKIGSTTAAAARGTAATSRDALDFCREQPLVLAGLGLAVGAAIGALMPRTQADGHASDADRGLWDHGEKRADNESRQDAGADGVDNPAAASAALPGSAEKQPTSAGSLVSDGESG